MKNVRPVWMLFAGALWVGCNAPHSPETPQPLVKPATITRLVHEPAETRTIQAGAADTLAFTFTVGPRFHAQANPVPHAYLIPATIKPDSSNYLTPGTPLYPPGHAYTLAGSTDTLSVYDGTFHIAVPLQTDAATPAGDYTVSGSFRYQTCDDTTCFPPKTIPVEHSIRITN
ncbi:MAG: protein-disulfide reductase DsbD domain-containing protein [Bacteroidota bacterium]